VDGDLLRRSQYKSKKDYAQGRQGQPNERCPAQSWSQPFAPRLLCLHIARLDLSLPLTLGADALDNMPAGCLFWIGPALVDLAGPIAAVAAQISPPVEASEEDKSQDCHAGENDEIPFHVAPSLRQNMSFLSFV
jgi:hypothetical protein